MQLLESALERFLKFRLIRPLGGGKTAASLRFGPLIEPKFSDIL